MAGQYTAYRHGRPHVWTGGHTHGIDLALGLGEITAPTHPLLQPASLSSPYPSSLRIRILHTTSFHIVHIAIRQETFICKNISAPGPG